MSKDLYVVLDSRAGVAAVSLSEQKGRIVTMNEVDEDWERYIMLADTADGCCKAVNEETYGGLCVVATTKGEIMWEWCGPNAKWSPK